MFPAISIAASGMTVQSQRLEAVARSIATMGTTATDTAASSGGGQPPVRVGALPVGDPLESMVTMREAEIAYRLNAVVIETAADMLDSLLAAVAPNAKS